MTLEVPISLKSEHDELLTKMRLAMRESGSVGEVARQVMQVLDGHMMREEKFALRPLGLLKALGRGETPAEMAEAARLTESLRHEMPQMLDEHRRIAQLLREFARASETEGKPEYVALAAELIQHAHVEEDVLYPAALLVGRVAGFVRGT